ncbi:MAG: phosphoglycerate kinase, partial [Gemmatimonadales bacterium]
MKRTLDQLDATQFEGQRALVRVDFNTPLREGAVTDDTRIRAALPTITHLRNHGARVILLSHLGRPHGRPDPQYSLRPVQLQLERLLGVPVTFIEDPTSDDAVAATKRLPRGAVALAENTRFYPGEETNDPAFSERLALLGDLYVNDAFGTAHRAHASTEGVARLLHPAVAGFLMERELEFLGRALDDPRRPFVAIMGGAKISGKIDVIEALLPRADTILIGGAMACTFFKAMGFQVGASLVEDDKIDLAGKLLELAGDKLVLPAGAVIAERLATDAPTRSVSREEIPEGWAMFDIDETTEALFARHIGAAGTVVWNGPMGVFETPPFDHGTVAVAQAMASATAAGTVTVVGGGDSAAA